MLRPPADALHRGRRAASRAARHTRQRSTQAPAAHAPTCARGRDGGGRARAPTSIVPAAWKRAGRTNSRWMSQFGSTRIGIISSTCAAVRVRASARPAPHDTTRGKAENKSLESARGLPAAGRRLHLGHLALGAVQPAQVRRRVHIQQHLLRCLARLHKLRRPSSPHVRLSPQPCTPHQHGPVGDVPYDGGGRPLWCILPVAGAGSGLRGPCTPAPSARRPHRAGLAQPAPEPQVSVWRLGARHRRTARASVSPWGAHLCKFGAVKGVQFFQAKAPAHGLARCTLRLLNICRQD
jgi:hypothetical protein